MNRELIATNWAIGRAILERQNHEGWGTRVIDRLAADLKNAFPAPKDFHPEISSTCGHLPKHGRTSQLCNALHNCLGAITLH
ncbi:DUF1016 N-terminal domain-containing protein [Arthrobacter sp. I2-34]|uniref:DUF1016 N-terminal domain-containing protein n=1 Tax=Arthrobacter hankyongi TaxID=2904801 RepID=A0ABS9L4B6_9MICC|nr:DUF1016 N-terminal domain-containing protein [Arthrobacter hankyongi]